MATDNGAPNKCDLRAKPVLRLVFPNGSYVEENLEGWQAGAVLDIVQPQGLTDAPEFPPVGSPEWWLYASLSIITVLVAGTMAGLTMGLVSLDATYVHILQECGDEVQKFRAGRVKWFVDHHHLTLVTLLLGNSLANEALPIFLNAIVNEYVAVLLSVTAVLIFGEILPSAICTGPNQLAIASFMAPVVGFLILVTGVISWPISYILDISLGDEHGTRYRREELKEFIKMHASHERAADAAHQWRQVKDKRKRHRLKEKRRRLREHIRRLRQRERGGRGAESGLAAVVRQAVSAAPGAAGGALGGREDDDDDDQSALLGHSRNPSSLVTASARLASSNSARKTPEGIDRSMSERAPSVASLLSLSDTSSSSSSSSDDDKEGGADAAAAAVQGGRRRRAGSPMRAGAASPRSHLRKINSEAVRSTGTGDRWGTSLRSRGGAEDATAAGPAGKQWVTHHTRGGSLQPVREAAAFAPVAPAATANSSPGTGSFLPGRPPRARLQPNAAAQENLADVAARSSVAVAAGAAGFLVVSRPSARSVSLSVAPGSIEAAAGAGAGGEGSLQTPLMGGDGLAGRRYDEEAGGEEEGGPEAAAGAGGADQVVQSTMLLDDEVTMIEGVLEMKGKRAHTVMTPVEDVFALSTDDVLDWDTMAAVLQSGFSRIPVYRADIGPRAFIGMLIVKLLIQLDPKEARPVSELELHKPLTVLPTTSLFDALNLMQTGQSHMALVTERPEELAASMAAGQPPTHGVRVVGILTIEDILEEILKEDIEDETDVLALRQ